MKVTISDAIRYIGVMIPQLICLRVSMCARGCL